MTDRKLKLTIVVAIVLSNLLGIDLVRATQQAPESIIVRGQQQLLLSMPLSEYLQVQNNAKKFNSLATGMQVCTLLQRRYLGEWELKDRKLYLNRLEVRDCNRSRQIVLPDLFAGKQSPIWANWYSGNLYIPQGKSTGLIRGGYGQLFDRYLVVKIDRGEIVGQKIQTKLGE
jgi:hypothetical protein